MAIDITAVCAVSEVNATPQRFFVAMSVVFALYIGVDVLVAALVLKRKLSDRIN
jgi:hypothetical protein|tara:strand:- start:1451 stop:1612 length:162 start_codon:yes stop_codon:yes gene_type:complete